LFARLSILVYQLQFLQFNGRDILRNAGSITAKLAKEMAEKEYKDFDKHRKKC